MNWLAEKKYKFLENLIEDIVNALNYSLSTSFDLEKEPDEGRLDIDKRGVDIIVPDLICNGSNNEGEADLYISICTACPWEGYEFSFKYKYADEDSDELTNSADVWCDPEVENDFIKFVDKLIYMIHHDSTFSDVRVNKSELEEIKTYLERAELFDKFIKSLESAYSTAKTHQGLQDENKYCDIEIKDNKYEINIIAAYGPDDDPDDITYFFEFCISDVKNHYPYLEHITITCESYSEYTASIKEQLNELDSKYDKYVKGVRDGI